MFTTENASPVAPPSASSDFQKNIRFVPAVVAKFRELAGRDPSQSELERFAPRFGGQAAGLDTWASIDAGIAKLRAPATANAAPAAPSGGALSSNVVHGAPPELAAEGYTRVASEDGSVTFNAPTDVVYGAGGKYVFRSGVSGLVTFNNATFGDPIPGIVKAGYARPASSRRMWWLLGLIGVAAVVWWFRRKG